MIHAEAVKAVQELLVERGIQPKEDERWGDYVARGLNVSDTQAEGFLHALDQNLSIEEACAAAGISPEGAKDGILVDIAREVGRALGAARSSMTPRS
jgi:fructose-1-phosphate kinase PfkB-like protein